MVLFMKGVPMRNAYEDALLVQDAVNLSGIVMSLSRHLTESVWPEVRAAGGGTDDVNQHPVTILFVNQILFLSTGECVDTEKFSKAYEVCVQKSGREV